MTVSTTQNRSAQNGNGATLVFNFPYLFLENDDLLVYVNNVLKTLTTDYSVTGAGGVGVAAVTFVVAPAVGVGNVVIINDPDRLQATALPSNGPFPSAAVERMADKLTLIVQRMYDLITRSLRLSDSDPSTVSTQLPSTAGNGTKVLRMNAAETALEYIDPGSAALAIPADGSVTRTKLAADVKSGTVSQLDTAFTTAGATPSFTLTPTPALAAYAAGVRYRVKFNSAGSGVTDNLNVSALGNKLLKQYNAAGAKVAAVFVANTLSDVEYDGVDLVMLDPIPPASTAVPRAYIAGCVLSTAGGSATMSIAAGQCADSTNAALIALAATSKTTGAFATGAGNGGLDTGAIANSTWYHFYAIDTAAGGAPDVTFSTNASAPTLNGAYVGGKFRRIGSSKTDGAAQWTAFVQDGDYFRWVAVKQDIAAVNPGVAAVTRTVTTPLGVRVRGIFAGGWSGGGDYQYLSDLSVNDEAPSAPIQTGATSSAPLGGVVDVWTNTSSQIRSRMNGGAAGTMYISTHGWLDLRGK